MGMSSDGVLAFGWDLGSPGDYGNYGDEKFQWASSLMEKIEESDDFDDIAMSYVPGWDVDEDWRNPGYFERAKAAKALRYFEIISYNHCDYPRYILTLPGKNWVVCTGDTKDVTEVMSYSTEELVELRVKLQNAAELLGLEPPENPKLLLTMDWD